MFCDDFNFFVVTNNKVWEVMIKTSVELIDKEWEIVATGNRKQKYHSNIKILFIEHSFTEHNVQGGKSDRDHLEFY